MPFTESELRAMLEDNSAEIPPVPDLATIAETHGKKIRRRRQIAGATAAAAVLAAGALALPGLLKSDHPGKAQVVAAAKVSPTQSGPVDVDYSVFESNPPQPIRQSVKDLEVLSKRLAVKRDSPSKLVFQPVGVAGTVTGFDRLALAPVKAAADPTATATATGPIVMKVRVNRSFKILGGPADSRTPLPPEGGIISVRVDSHTSIDRYRKAVPAGVRLVAFSVPYLGIAVADTNYSSATLIFEKADRSLIGGPYQTGHVPAPWSMVKTMDELIAAAPKLPFPCRTFDPKLQAIIEKIRDVPSASAVAILSGLLRECTLGVAPVRENLSAYPGPTP
jgi:hypothetical protein